MGDAGNEAQLRIMLDQVAEAAATNAMMRMKAGQLDQPQTKEAPIPPLIKWLVGAIAAFGSTALIGLGIWLVTSVSQMSETLARMDERMKGADSAQEGRFEELQRRVSKLETYHQEGGR